MSEGNSTHRIELNNFLSVEHLRIVIDSAFLQPVLNKAQKGFIRVVFDHDLHRVPYAIVAFLMVVEFCSHVFLLEGVPKVESSEYSGMALAWQHHHQLVKILSAEVVVGIDVKDQVLFTEVKRNAILFVAVGTNTKGSFKSLVCLARDIAVDGESNSSFGQ